MILLSTQKLKMINKIPRKIIYEKALLNDSWFNIYSYLATVGARQRWATRCVQTEFIFHCAAKRRKEEKALVDPYVLAAIIEHFDFITQVILLEVSSLTQASYSYNLQLMKQCTVDGNNWWCCRKYSAVRNSYPVQSVYMGRGVAPWANRTSLGVQLTELNLHQIRIQAGSSVQSPLGHWWIWSCLCEPADVQSRTSIQVFECNYDGRNSAIRKLSLAEHPFDSIRGTRPFIQTKNTKKFRILNLLLSENYPNCYLSA